jgi:hypothetical protein
MADWTGWLIALAAALVLIPVFAWAGRRLGSKTKGGFALACLMLGFDAVMDPPTRHPAESATPPKGSPDNDEPPLP